MGVTTRETMGVATGVTVVDSRGEYRMTVHGCGPGVTVGDCRDEYRTV